MQAILALEDGRVFRGKGYGAKGECYGEVVFNTSAGDFSGAPTPDLVIYLQATPEVLKKRVKKKNAPGEKAISEEYLGEVVKAYEHFFFHYTSSDLLIVNTSEIDFVERNEDLQELLRKVSAPINGTQYFLPLGSQEAASA